MYAENIYRCTPEAKELAYTSLVCPLMEFAAPASDTYGVKDIDKFEMVQRRAARFAKSDDHRTTSVSKLIDDFGLENPFISQKRYSFKHVWQGCGWQSSNPS